MGRPVEDRWRNNCAGGGKRRTRQRSAADEPHRHSLPSLFPIGSATISLPPVERLRTRTNAELRAKSDTVAMLVHGADRFHDEIEASQIDRASV
jgi:hypothetical protein